MPTYSGIQKEETLKGLVHNDYFPEFGYEPNIDNIDFVITDKKTTGDLYAVNSVSASTHYLWAEAKKGVYDVETMLTQLILTFKKTYDKGDYMPPPFIGCFDSARIAFLPFHDILPIFSESDFNWNITPSNHDSADFQKAKQTVTKLIGNIMIFHFETDTQDIKDFIRTNFVAGSINTTKKPITKSNFMHIYNKWVKEVMPTINMGQAQWEKYKKKGLLDCDFYLADIMSDGGNTIDEKLNVILENDIYKLQEEIENEMWSRPINFTDDGAAYRRFWNRYERPPKEEYQQYIIGRRDLLVPQNIREIKGSFFTPPEWVEKSQEYLARVYGEDWQDEYYVWDPAAGTGNLLAGLVNKYNVWASTVDQPDVFSMHSAIQDGFNLLDDHVFQFDFLNDSFDKLPAELKKIIDDEQKRRKLIVYFNPPYAESSGGEKAKTGVSTQHKTHEEYKKLLGKASNELFSQFIIRIAALIPHCNLAMFSTLKYLNSSNFKNLRRVFSASFMNGFMVHADTFDNVHGKFPIGFLIWKLTEDYHISEYELKQSEFPKEIKLDVLDTAGSKIAQKGFYNGGEYINKWFVENNAPAKESIGKLYYTSNDFQQNNLVFISLTETTSHLSYNEFAKSNLVQCSIYFSARHCFEHTWLNDRDQFYFPKNDGYKTDTEFQNDCLVFTLFHGQNRISSRDGINHWIPFTEKEVGAREKFESAFMSEYLSVKTFSAEAKAVLDAGRELWKYYHEKTKDNKTVSHNASYYDIREYFQGRKESGTMNTKSTDETYNALLAALRGALKTLTAKIQPKVYEYGFLKE
ncbi:MAG: hypothetical protein Ta2A_07460 [Treponemataceae bacterium]|nr:MAG: hypothetical protein Ta2A_07460 [Treponemataceae bacterium]